MAFKSPQQHRPSGHLDAFYENLAAPGRVRVPVDELASRLHRTAHAFRIEVTGEHLEVLKAIFTDWSNVFLTGAAGTGKTTFIQKILVPELDHRGMNYAVTATTGIAGNLLGGRTLHSWAGIGLGPLWNPTTPVLEHSAAQIAAVYRSTYEAWNDPAGRRGNAEMRNGIKKRIQGCQFLILDEVSMQADWGFV